MKYLKLINRKPVPFKHDMTGFLNGFTKEYAKYFDDFRKRKVRNQYIGKIQISTVFLGYDHAIGKLPKIFETMIFGFDNNFTYRCATWREALKQHQTAVAIAKAKIKQLK